MGSDGVPLICRSAEFGDKFYDLTNKVQSNYYVIFNNGKIRMPIKLINSLLIFVFTERVVKLHAKDLERSNLLERMFV